MNVPMEQWDLPKWYFPMMKTLQAISDIGVLVVEWLLPSILTWYREKIMKMWLEEIATAVLLFGMLYLAAVVVLSL